METKVPQADNSQNVLQWMASERLYEEYLFFYVLILVFWAAVGYFSFGFEIEGYSQPENLFVNFLLFLLLATAMALTPLWYRLIFGTHARLARRTQEIYEQVEKIEDEEKRKTILRYLEQDGALPPRKLQKWCLILLGWCAIFELFFISAWVKDLQLIWQPEWIKSIIAWMENHINTPPLNQDRKFFYITIDSNNFLSKFFSSEKEFLESSYGSSVMVFHFFRFFENCIILFCLCILLWDLSDWLGMKRVVPRTVNINSFLGGFLFFILSLFLVVFSTIFFFVSPIYMFFRGLRISAIILLSKQIWAQEFWLNSLLTFMFFSIKITIETIKLYCKMILGFIKTTSKG